MKRSTLEVWVGLFVMTGFAAFAFMAVKLGNVKFMGSDRYRVSARFGSVSGLKPGAPVEVAGVKVGEVASINVDAKAYEAVVSLEIDRGVDIPKDSIASIRTAGIIGDKFIKITPGADDKALGADGKISETESAISLEELVSKYIFEKK